MKKAYWPDSPEARKVFQSISASTRLRRMRTGAVVDDEATPTSSSIICNETAKEAVQSVLNFIVNKVIPRFASTSSKVGEMKSPIRYEDNNFFITKYF